MDKELYGTGNIGKKIRATRLEKGLTQTQLAGEYITRNMLSCIESGTALPSVPTLLYLSDKLGISPAYLLSAEGEDGQLRKLTVISSIREAYKAGQFEDCLLLCRNLLFEDEELCQIRFGCLVSLGKNAADEMRLKDAAAYFEEALSIPDDMLYLSDAEKAESRFRLLLIGHATEETVSPELLRADAPGEWKPFLAACGMLDSGDINGAAVIRSSGLVTNAPMLHYLDAYLAVLRGDPLSAIPHLQTITGAAKPEFYIFYRALVLLEKCYESMENYKDAYAVSKRRAAAEDKFRE